MAYSPSDVAKPINLWLNALAWLQAKRHQLQKRMWGPKNLPVAISMFKRAIWRGTKIIEYIRSCLMLALLRYLLRTVNSTQRSSHSSLIPAG